MNKRINLAAGLVLGFCAVIFAAEVVLALGPLRYRGGNGLTPRTMALDRARMIRERAARSHHWDGR